MRFVLLHYHILKNAGSTIEEMLDRSFGERFARLDAPGRDHTIDHSALLDFCKTNPNLDAVSSHQIRYPLPEARGILFFDVCFVRDPIARVRSMYDYFRQKPAAGDPVSDLANSSGPGAFVAGMVKDHALQIRNVQVNLIAAAGDSDAPTEADLDLATSRMRDAAFPGVVGNFDESIATGEHRLRTIFPRLDCSGEPVNVSGSTENLREACDPEVWDILLRMNALDLELVKRVRAEVNRRTAQIDRSPERQNKAKLPCTPEQLFDRDFYLARYPDIRAARIDPLRHYLTHGMAEGRKPNPLFQPDYYAAQCNTYSDGPGNALRHFLKNEPNAACNPHRLFDSESYLTTHSGAAASGINPLLHYLESRQPDHWKGLRLQIDDVNVNVVLAETCGLSGEVVRVWRDGDGRKQLIAPPQQRPFFENVSCQQLHAQFKF